MGKLAISTILVLGGAACTSPESPLYVGQQQRAVGSSCGPCEEVDVIEWERRDPRTPLWPEPIKHPTVITMGFEDNIWVSCNVDPGSKSIVSAHHGNAANFAEMIQANYEEWFAYAGELPPGSIIPLIGGTFGGTPGNPPIPKIPEELVREIVQQAGAMSGMSQFGTTAIQNEIK